MFRCKLAKMDEAALKTIQQLAEDCGRPLSCCFPGKDGVSNKCRCCGKSLDQAKESFHCCLCD